MLRTAKVVGLNSDQLAAQVYIGNTEKQPCLFVLAYCDCDDAFLKAKQLLVRSEEIFYSSASPIPQRLQEVLEKLHGETYETGPFHFLAAAFQEEVLYLMHQGSGEQSSTPEPITAYLIRDNNPSSLLELASGNQLVSGYLKDGDRVVIATESLTKLLGEDFSKISKWEIEEIEDEITSRLSQAPLCPIAAIFIDKFNPEEKIPVIEGLRELPQQPKNRDFKQLVQKTLVHVSRFIPKSKRGAAVTGISLLLVVLAGMGFSYNYQKEARRTQSFNGFFNQASESYNQAKALKDLNPADAAKSLEQAKSSLEKALKISSNEKAGLELKKQIETDSSDILKVYQVNDIPLWLDLELVKQGLTASKLSLSVGNLLVFDPNKKTLVKIELGKKAHQILAGSEKLGDAKFASINGAVAYVFSEDKGIIKVDSTNSSLDTAVKKDDTWGKIGDIFGFAGNIYLLDEEKNKIYKYVPTLSGYGGPKNYLQPNTSANFTGAIRMQIDSSVWILRSSGELLKYTQGVSDYFSFSGLDKSVSDPKSFFVSSDTEKLYLLDGDNSRLVVFDKKGVYLAQYLSSRFKSFTDLAVDEKEKKAYLLEGSKIYTIELK